MKRLYKNVVYSVAVHLSASDIKALSHCCKQYYNWLTVDEFWYYKLSRDFPKLIQTPFDYSYQRWYQLVHILDTIFDPYEFEDVRLELYYRRDYIGTAILWLASAHYDHIDIQAALYEIDENIVYDQLPLTNEQFKFLPGIVTYLKNRREQTVWLNRVKP